MAELLSAETIELLDRGSVTRDDEYRRQGAEAERQAQLAKNDHNREAWLRIAQGWMGLVSKRPQSEADAFQSHSTATKTTDEDFDFARPP